MSNKHLKEGVKAVVINHPDKNENGKVVKLVCHNSTLNPVLFAKDDNGKKLPGKIVITIEDGDYWYTDKAIRLSDHLDKTYYINAVESKYLALFKEKVTT